MSGQNCLPIHCLNTNIINKVHIFQQRSLERNMDCVIKRGTFVARSGGLSDILVVRSGGLSDIVVARSGGLSDIVVARSGGLSDIVVVRSGGFRDDW